jgi:hypothetical protein
MQGYLLVTLAEGLYPFLTIANKPTWIRNVKTGDTHASPRVVVLVELV